MPSKSILIDVLKGNDRTIVRGDDCARPIGDGMRQDSFNRGEAEFARIDLIDADFEVEDQIGPNAVGCFEDKEIIAVTAQ
jgi:hypothetical protein